MPTFRTVTRSGELSRGPSNRVRRIWRFAAALLLLLASGGCAHVWVDADGNRHALGLVHVVVPAPSTAISADTVRVRALGATWTRAEIGSSLIVGYGDTTLGFMRSDSCAVWSASHQE